MIRWLTTQPWGNIPTFAFAMVGAFLLLAILETKGLRGYDLFGVLFERGGWIHNHSKLPNALLLIALGALVACVCFEPSGARQGLMAGLGWTGVIESLRHLPKPKE